MSIVNKLFQKLSPKIDEPITDFRIAVVSNTALFRKAFTYYIAEKYAVLFSVSNSEELKTNLNSGNLPHFILVDIDRNLEDSLLICNWLKENYSPVKVIALTIDSDREPLDRMFACGADGYFLKTIMPGEIDAAFRQIIKGKIYHNMPLHLLYTTYVSDQQLRKFAKEHGFLD